MKEQEVREFRYFLNRHPQTAGGDAGAMRRDITLLELLRKNINTKDNPDFASQLYGKNQDRNAYHQLRNRLRKSLEEFIFFESSRRGGEYETRKHIEIARFFYQRKAYSQAMHALSKAEAIAHDEQQFAELENIFNLMISFSMYIPEIELTAVMQKRKINQQKLEKQLHYLYLRTEIRKVLEHHHDFTSHIDIDYALNKLMTQHGIREEDPEHAGLWLEITALVSDVLIHKNKKALLEQYLVLKHHEFNEKGVFSSVGNGNKLRMLWQIAGLMYCNKRFDGLEKFLFELRHETSKLQEYYPNLGHKVRFIEAIAAIRTQQLSRCRHILDQLNPTLVPQLWLVWANILLAIQEQETKKVEALLQSAEMESGSPLNIDSLLLLIDINRIKKIYISEFDCQQACEEVNKKFEAWLLNNPSCTYANCWQIDQAANTNNLTLLKLPEAGSIGFLTLQS